MKRHLHISRIALQLAFVFSLLMGWKVSAQTYPIQAHIVTTGPYLNYLSYYGDQNNHLQITLTNLDFNSPSVLVRLRLHIEGSGWELYTNPNATIGQPFLLDPGMPLTITGIELLPYLLQNNLVNPNGIDLNNLPEDFATICVDVIRESANQEVLSTNNCALLPIQLVRPPTPYLPDCGTRLDTTTMFELFQWFAPNPPAVGMGVETKYDLSIYYWQDTTNFSDNAWLFNPIYQQSDIAWVELFNVELFDLLLVPGGKYVWNVKARVFVDGVEKTNATLNNGLSQNCVFYYGEAPTLADQLADGLEIVLTAEQLAERKGIASWTVNDNTPYQGLSQFDEYVLEYRKQPTGNEGFEIPWFSKTLTNTSDFIYQLEPSTTYEVKVSGVIAGVVGDPTPVVTFTTPDPRVYNCGEADLPYLPSNYTPLENATVGTQVQIGQFTMTMTELNEFGGGHYAGKGTIPIPFLGGAKAKVRFDDILIDTEYRVHEGRVDVITEGLDNWLNEQYQQFIDPYYVNGTIDSAWVDTVAGVAWVTVDGVDQQFTFDPPTYPIIVNDEKGNQYTIYPNGTIIVTNYLAISETWTVNADEVVYFTQNVTELRGFDAKEHMQWHENYEIMMLADSSKYFVANKSLAKDEGDYVNVEIPSGVNASFEFSDGTPINVLPLQSDWLGETMHIGSTKMTLNIPARSNTGNYSIYAFANNQKVGQLNVVVYSKKERELVVVPIASTNLTAAQIKAELDNTLGEANLDIDVEITPQWTDTTGTFTASTNISLPTEVGLLNKYSDDMREIRDLYFEQNPNADKSKYYIFLVNGFDEPNELGYMVRGRALGFVKASQQDVLHTISHELGHGMGALEHSWKSNGPGEGTTNNLMDYAGGNNLTKAQWKELRDLDVVPSLWDGVEDGSGVALTVSSIPERLKNPDGTLSFFSGDELGQIITLPANTIDVYLSTSDPFVVDGQLTGDISPIGALNGFSIDDGSGIPMYYKVELSPTFGTISYRLQGVQESVNVNATGNSNGSQSSTFDIQSTDNLDTLLANSNFYVDPYTKVLTNPVVIVGLPYYEGGEIGYTLYASEANSYTQPTENKNTFGLISSSPFFAISKVKNYNQLGNGVALPNVNPEFINYREWFQLNNGQGVSVTSSYGTENLSPLALGYLDKFEGFTKRGSVLGPILIAISEWVTRLETSEVYSNCVLDSDLPVALSFFQPEQSRFNSGFTPAPIQNVDPYQQMEDNASVTLMEQNWINADAARIELIEDFYYKFYDIFNGISQSNNISTDINAELTAATNAQEVISILRGYTLCDYEVISFDNRMKCIDLIHNSNPYTNVSSFFNPAGLINAWGEAWSAQEYNEVLVVKLVNGTKYNGQSDAMSDELFKNNAQLFWKFFNYTDGSEYHSFMNTLLELTMVYNQTNPAVTIDFGQFENNKVMHSSYNESINSFIYELMQSNTQGLYYTPLHSLSPETMVTVDLSTNIQLANLSDFYSDFVGGQITIPAFYLHYMEEQRINQNLTKAAMVLLDLVVIVGSAGTATPYAIASIALAGSNIVVTLNEDAIAQMNGGQDFLNVWSLVQVVDGVNGLTQLGIGIGKKFSNGSLKLFFSLDNMSNGLAQIKTSSAYTESYAALEKIRRLWYFMQFAGEDVVANMMKSKLMMKLEAKVLKKNYSKIDQTADLEIANLYNVKVQGENVLTMNPNSKGMFVSGNIVDDIPENSVVLARFDDVRFNDGSPSIQEGDLVVYKKTNGEFVCLAKKPKAGSFNGLIDEIDGLVRIMTEDGSVVATGSANFVNGYAVLQMTIVTKGTTVTGRQAVQQTVKYMNDVWEQPVEGFLVNWKKVDGLSDNIDFFNEKYLEALSNGFDEATSKSIAYFETFSGKMATEQGFTNLQYINGIKNNQGKFTSIEGLVTK